MKTPSVIFITPYSQGDNKGSMGTYTFKMIQELEKFGVKCNVHEVKATGIGYFKRIIYPLFDSWSLFFSKEKIIYVNYAFFLNFIFLLPFLIIARFVFRKKIILQLHEYWKFLPFSNIVKCFDILYCLSSNKIVVHNVDQYFTLKGYGFKNIELFHMPIDNIKVIQNEIRKNKINILMHGGIIRKKGLDLGINALKLLPDNYILTIVGGIWDKLYYNELLFLIKKLKLENRINFISKALPNNEYEDFIKNANIIIYPYTIATASAALSDGALKFEKPFLTSDIDSFISYLGTNKYSFKNLDFKELASKIVNIDLYESIKYSKLMKKKYNWSSMGKQLFSIICN